MTRTRVWSGISVMMLATVGSLLGCGDDATTPATTCADAGDASCSDASPAVGVDGAADAPADASDAACVLIVDDADITHGCGRGGMGPGDRDDGGGATPPPSDASPDAHDLPFAASCLRNAQCASDICYLYRVRGTFCTQTCAKDGDCPPTSPGCNGMGLCRLPE